MIVCAKYANATNRTNTSGRNSGTRKNLQYTGTTRLDMQLAFQMSINKEVANAYINT
jgi:hypothetical protein